MSRDINSLLFVTLLPLLIVGQAILLIWLVNHFGGEAIVANPIFQTALGKLREALPAAAGLPIGEQLQVLLLSQFNFYLLLIPTMIAISFATFSIVEEKLSRSLEALLVNLVLNPSWFITLFLLTPAVTVLSFVLGIIGSSRAKDAKSAQNMALVIILPVLVLIGIQVTGLVWFTPLLTLALALGVSLLDIILLRIAVDLFQRESIVVKWH